MSPIIRSTFMAVSLGALAEGLLAGAMVRAWGFESSAAFAAALCYIAVATVVVARIASFHPHPAFGAANSVTLIRLVFTGLFAGLVWRTAMHDAPLTPEREWLSCAVGIFVLALDGVDGYMARKSGQTSAFGARFDMEVDALLILMLSLLAVTLHKAGAWIIAAGLLRYLYVMGGWFWLPLAQPLPESLRRKFVCVVQCGVLVILLAPIVTPPVSAIAAAIALALLVYSFAVDVAWTIRHRHSVLRPV